MTLHFRDSHTVPRWLKRSISLMRLGCIKCEKKSQAKDKIKIFQKNIIDIGDKEISENIEDIEHPKQMTRIIEKEEDMSVKQVTAAMDKIALIYSYIFLLILFIALVISLCV